MWKSRKSISLEVNLSNLQYFDADLCGGDTAKALGLPATSVKTATEYADNMTMCLKQDNFRCSKDHLHHREVYGGHKANVGSLE